MGSSGKRALAPVLCQSHGSMSSYRLCPGAAWQRSKESVRCLPMALGSGLSFAWLHFASSERVHWLEALEPRQLQIVREAQAPRELRSLRVNRGLGQPSRPEVPEALFWRAGAARHLHRLRAPELHLVHAARAARHLAAWAETGHVRVTRTPDSGLSWPRRCGLRPCAWHLGFKAKRPRGQEAKRPRGQEAKRPRGKQPWAMAVYASHARRTVACPRKVT